MLRFYLAAGICALALAACAERESAPPPAAPPSGPTGEFIAYQCGELSVEFNYERGALKVGEETMFLADAVAGSGARYVAEYVADKTEFWSKGDRAMLTLRGVEYPECIEKGTLPEASGSDIFRARGNEPGWLLELGSATYKFTGDYGESIVGGKTPAPETLSDGILYTVAENNLSIRIYDGLCNDDATGAPFPKRVTVTLGEKTYAGCGGDSVGLLVGEWRVTHIAGAAVVPDSGVSIGFDDQGLVFGDASCNRYSGKYGLTPERLAFQPLVATEKACLDPALMAQERQFLDKLQVSDRFDIAGDASLVLYAADTETIRAHR